MSRKTNVRRIRKAEVEAVAEILAAVDEDSEMDVEELSKQICRAINKIRAEEPNWVRVVRHGSGYLMYGPYRSPAEARDDDSSWGPSTSMEQPEMRLWSLVPPFGQGEGES